MMPQSSTIPPGGPGRPSRVIQGFFPGGQPRILQPAVASPVAPVAPSRPAPVQARPAGFRPPVVPGLPNPIQPTLRPGFPANNPQPIRPNAARHGAIQPVTATKPTAPQPILPPVPRPAAIQPSSGQALALPPGFQLRPSGLGQRLPDPIQRRMEAFFQADFSQVRVHVGNEASSIGALAFAHGTDLYFAPGQYNPQTPQGQRLLGHELTHVVQQRAGRVRNPLPSGIAVVQDPALEAEAERMGQRAASAPIPTVAQAKLMAQHPAPTIPGSAPARVPDAASRSPIDSRSRHPVPVMPSQVQPSFGRGPATDLTQGMARRSPAAAILPKAATPGQSSRLQNQLPGRREPTGVRPPGLPDAVKRASQDGRAIQRAVGFEFEVDEVNTYKKNLWRTLKPLNKQDKLLDKPGLFSVEADEREDGTTDMEIVTAAFPENRDGFRKLDQAMGLIVRLCDKLKQLNTAQHRVISAAELAEFGTPIANRWFRAKNDNHAFGLLTAKPQATAGILLSQLDRLLGDIGHGTSTGAGSEARKAVGGGYEPLNNPDVAGLPGIQNARRAAGEAIEEATPAYQRYRKHAAHPLGSPELRALLALLVTYLVEGKKGLSGYAKTIAMPIMARTDFAKIYSKLPDFERTYFAQTRGKSTWLNLVLRAADASTVLAPIGGAAPPQEFLPDAAVIEGRMFNNYLMYHQDPRYQTDVLPELKRRQWLNGIAFEGKDFLTTADYPGSREKKKELQGLGGYGKKMDKALGGEVANAPIFEFRGLSSLNYSEWHSFALSFMKYIRLVNSGAAGDFDTALTGTEKANLMGVGISDDVRDDHRQHRRLRVMAATNYW
jgi:hypothetical protein